MLIGYARVSTFEQDTQLQLDAMAVAGVHRVFQEKKSSVVERPVLAEALAELRTGDVLVVYKVDRLARSLIHLMELLRELDARGCGFKSLTEPIENTTAAGRLMLQILGAFAEFERQVIKERCTAGRIAARAQGVMFGRPPLLTSREVEDIGKSGLGCLDAARAYGVSRDAMRRACKKYGVVLPDCRGRFPRPARDIYIGAVPEGDQAEAAQ